MNSLLPQLEDEYRLFCRRSGHLNPFINALEFVWGQTRRLLAVIYPQKFLVILDHSRGMVDLFIRALYTLVDFAEYCQSLDGKLRCT